MFSLWGGVQFSCLPLKNICKILQSPKCPLELRMMPIGGSTLDFLRMMKNNNPLLGPSYLKCIFILHPNPICMENMVGMQSYFSPMLSLESLEHLFHHSLLHWTQDFLYEHLLWSIWYKFQCIGFVHCSQFFIVKKILFGSGINLNGNKIWKC